MTERSEHSKNPKHFDVIINETSHQTSSSECGMYALYFNIRELEDNPINEGEVIGDEIVESMRTVYFRPAQLCKLKK
jgi:hypothetical protein